MTGDNTVCVACTKLIEQADAEYANDNNAHPGVLGPIHPGCYNSLVATEPELPWTDAISGEVDYEAMEEDLGIDYGSVDDMEDEDF